MNVVTWIFHLFLFGKQVQFHQYTVEIDFNVFFEFFLQKKTTLVIQITQNIARKFYLFLYKSSNLTIDVTERSINIGRTLVIRTQTIAKTETQTIALSVEYQWNLW